MAGTAACPLCGIARAREGLGPGLPVDPVERRERRCETVFYLGEHALTRNDRAGAATLIREAAENCPVGFLERAAAIGELKRLQP